ncbi:hypothetical protein HGA64_02845 [Candidatus Falkowbacteria bacterium]|nr:hypothetical protein [Candidatus Falkowbacteria bacterium]
MAIRFKPMSKTQMTKNLQGKSFGGTSALKRYKEKVTTAMGQKTKSDLVVKHYTINKLANKSGEYVKHFLYRMGLNERQREEVIEVIQPGTREISREEQRILDKKKAGIKDYNISTQMQPGMAKSNLHTVLAGASANVTTGFASKGNSGQSKSGFASDAGKEIIGLTGNNEKDVTISKDAQTNHHLQF